MDGVAIVLFSDLVDSTRLLARLGDDRMDEIRRAHVEDVAAAVAGGRLRPLLEPLRPYVSTGVPMPAAGLLPQWHIGRLELLAQRPRAAVDELRPAVARADALGLVWQTASTRMDLALALHRRDRPGDRGEALAALAEGEATAERYAMSWVSRQAAMARAELEGHDAPADPLLAAQRGHTRSVRALSARTRRRALAALVRGQDDEALERRFSEPRRQCGLLRAMARGFQPAHAGGFRGVIAYELEPYAIEAPAEHREREPALGVADERRPVGAQERRASERVTEALPGDVGALQRTPTSAAAPEECASAIALRHSCPVAVAARRTVVVLPVPPAPAP